MAKDWHFKTHGMTNTPIYRLWWGMISRCTHPKTSSYERYGGMGITVCSRWMKFENFYKDMGDRPEGMTLERIDSSKGYEPENVRWASNHEQQRNKATNVRVNWGGKVWILSDLCKYLGVQSTHLYRNIKRGLSLIEAIQHLVNLKEKRDGKIQSC